MKRFIFILLILCCILSKINTNAKTIIPMGEFKLTAYCPCECCSEGYGRLTSTRIYARSSHTIAVDPDVIDYGSKVEINGKIYKAEDCGGLVKGDHIDIFFDTHEEVKEFGTKYRNVFVVKK